MEPDPAERPLEPDTRRANAMPFYAGASGAIPTHWNNSPFLTGGRLTSAFGANPKAKKKSPIMSYREFIESIKKVSQQ
jgi:hypothetical protein